MGFPERHVTQLLPKAMCPAEEETLIRRICAYMGFRVRRRRNGWIIIEVPSIGTDDGVRFLRPSIWSFESWNGVLFGHQPPECDYTPSIIEDLSEFMPYYGPGCEKNIGFDYGKFEAIRSSTVEELDLKLSVLGY